MLVYHDPEGTILYTLTARDLPAPAGTCIEVDIDDGDLDMMQWRVEDGVLVPRTDAAALAAAKANAHARLVAIMTAARTALITVLPGQDMIYLAKEAEGRAWLATTDPDIADYPLLSAEIGITAEDADQLAQLWLNMAALWRNAAASLEALRLSTTAAIDAATTPAAALAAIIPLEV